MIKYSLVACLIFLTNYCVGQNFTVTPLKNNKVYLGVDNPLNSVVENFPCKSVFLSTENGKITKSGCHFNYHPARIEDAKIKILIKENGQLKEIGHAYLRVRDFPPPVAYVGVFNGGKIKKESLIAQTGIGASAEPSLGFELSFRVDSFFTCIVRKDSVLYSCKKRNNLFSTELISVFKSLEAGDEIIFFDIACSGADKKKLTAKPIEFYIE
jgi:hypothetical protein